MVVAVLMTSCQVFENPNSGPLTSQATMSSAASANPAVLPVTAVAHVENCSRRRPNELRLRGMGSHPPCPRIIARWDCLFRQAEPAGAVTGASASPDVAQYVEHRFARDLVRIRA